MAAPLLPEPLLYSSSQSFDAHTSLLPDGTQSSSPLPPLPASPEETPITAPLLEGRVSTSSELSVGEKKINAAVLNALSKLPKPTLKTLQDLGRTINISSNITQKVGTTLTTNVVALNQLKATRILAGFSILISAHAAYHSAKELKGEGAGWDPALELASNLGAISIDTSNLLNSLKPILMQFSMEAANKAGAAAIAAAPILTGAGIVLSLAAVASNSKSIHECRKLLKSLDKEIMAEQKAGKPIESYSKMLHKLFPNLDNEPNSQVDQASKTRTKMLKKHFGIDPKVLEGKVDTIDKVAKKTLTAGNAVHQEKAEKILKETTTTLRGRIKAKIASHAVAITAVVANIIGLVILVVCPPAGLALILAFSCMALCGVLSLGKIGYDRHVAASFSRKMDSHAAEAKKLEEELNSNIEHHRITSELTSLTRTDSERESANDPHEEVNVNAARTSVADIMSNVTSRTISSMRDHVEI